MPENKNHVKFFKMPIYIGDYLAETFSLTLQERGIHMLLLIECWRNGGFPKDIKAIRKIINAPSRLSDESIIHVLQRFTEVDNQMVSLGTIKEQERILKCRESGRLGNQARWNANRETVAVRVRVKDKDIIPNLTLKETSTCTKLVPSTQLKSVSPLWPECEFFRMSDDEYQKVKAWYTKNGHKLELIEHAIREVDLWLGGVGGGVKARKQDSHYRRLYQAWVLELANKAYKMSLNAKPFDRQKALQEASERYISKVDIIQHQNRKVEDSFVKKMEEHELRQKFIEVTTNKKGIEQ